MNTETMNTIVRDEIVGKLTNVLEEMTTNEFIEMIIDNYFKETGKNLEDELPEDIDIHDFVDTMIGEKIVPLYVKLSEYIVELNTR